MAACIRGGGLASLDFRVRIHYVIQCLGGIRVPGRCERITKSCHSERSEESAVVCFQKDKSRFFASLRMTDDFFTCSWYPFLPILDVPFLPDWYPFFPTGTLSSRLVPFLPEESRAAPLEPLRLEPVPCRPLPAGAGRVGGFSSPPLCFLYLRSSSRRIQSPGARSYFQNPQPLQERLQAAIPAAEGERYTFP